MGLKSVILVASVFLGRRIMEAEFSHSKPWAFNVNKLFMAAITSSNGFPTSFEEGAREAIRSRRFVGRHGVYNVFYLILGKRHLQIRKIMLIVA